MSVLYYYLRENSKCSEKLAHKKGRVNSSPAYFQEAFDKSIII